MNGENYEMIIWWSDEDAAFVVEVPEPPGCMTHCSSRQDGIRHAEDAISFWIKTAQEDGLEISQPREVWFTREPGEAVRLYRIRPVRLAESAR